MRVAFVYTEGSREVMFCTQEEVTEVFGGRVTVMTMRIPQGASIPQLTKFEPRAVLLFDAEDDVTRRTVLAEFAAALISKFAARVSVIHAGSENRWIEANIGHRFVHRDNVVDHLRHVLRFPP